MIRLYILICLTSFTWVSCTETISKDIDDGGYAEKDKVSTKRSEHPEFKRLKDAIEQYEEIAAQGGWPTIPHDVGVLRPGMSAEVIATIKERLRITGDLAKNDAEGTVYDDALALAVGEFQQRHGMQVDGIVGPNTIARMNIPVEEKLEKLRFSLANWENLPEDLGQKYVFVNIPEFRLTAYENEEEILEMRVIVGEAYETETPSFNDSIQYLEFNPFWNIPHSIVQRTMLPQARTDLGYLERNGYELVTHFDPEAEVLEPTQENLDRLEREEIFLRQRPGPNNAMGLVKFMFPNKHAIYLHDTPQDQLFQASERAFSNGCIRVEHPVDLADFLLSGNASGDWHPEQIRQEMDNGQLRQVYLEEKIPIYLIYWTAFADEDGTVNFREDIYDKRS